MKLRLIALVGVILIVLVLGLNEEKDSPGEWQWDDKDAAAMKESWCEYNKGRDFAVGNCEEYWSSNKESE